MKDLASNKALTVYENIELIMISSRTQRRKPFRSYYIIIEHKSSLSPASAMQLLKDDK